MSDAPIAIHCETTVDQGGVHWRKAGLQLAVREHVCGHVCRHVSRHVYTHVCRHTCADTCVDVGVDTCAA